MFCNIIQYLFKDLKSIKPIVLIKSRIQLKDAQEIEQILIENHNSKLAGHAGFARTYKRIKQYYKWNNIEIRYSQIYQILPIMSIK